MIKVNLLLEEGEEPKTGFDKAREVLGVIVRIAGIPTALFVGLWLCLVGGVVQIVNGITPTVNSMDIGIGVLRIIATAPAGWATFYLTWIIGGIIIGSSHRTPKIWRR